MQFKEGLFVYFKNKGKFRFMVRRNVKKSGRRRRVGKEWFIRSLTMIVISETCRSMDTR